MKKLSLYLLVLLVFISCGKTGSSEKYLKVLSVTPTSSQEDAKISEPITIKFNEEVKEVSIALIDTKAREGEVEGVSAIINDKATFTPKNDLDYSTYKVNIYKEGTTSSSDKKLKENYSYTFTTSPEKVDTIPNIPADKKEEEKKEDKKEKETTNNSQAYSTCDLIPQMNCDDIKKIDTN